MRKSVLAAVFAALTVLPAGAHIEIRPNDCAWAVKADSDRINIAFPDEGAQYWATSFTALPQSRLTIRGDFPRGRYFSFHLYEGSVPVQGIADVEIAPSQGANPFLPGADRSGTGSYTVHVVPGPVPATPAPNTLYAQGLNGENVPAGTILYRIYQPEGDIRGGVALPSVRHEFDVGTELHVGPTLPSCQQAAPQEDHTVNEAVKAQSLPWTSSAQPTEPAWVISRSRPQPTDVGPTTVYTGNVFFANFHNEYLRLLAFRNAGDVVAFRAKAPTFAATRGASTMPSGEELRYWSICTNDLSTTRYVACASDEQTALDEEGYFTFVVSDVAHKPKNLRPTDTWLPNGPYTDFFILYRHMLPSPTFGGAIQAVPAGGAPNDSMGDYYPVTRVCPTARFETDRCGLPG